MSLPRYRLGLVFAAAFVLLAYKLLTIAALGLLPIMVGWLLETAVLASWYLLFEPGRPQQNKLLRRGLSTLFLAGFSTLVIVSIAHTFFFESAAERRISLLEVDVRTLVFFFTKVLPLRGLLLMVGLVLAIGVLAWPIARLLKPSSWQQLLVLAALWGAVALLLLLVPRPPSPIADMGADLWEQLTTPEVVVDRQGPAPYRPSSLDKSASPATSAPVYHKVLVFVMETMTSEVMEEQRKLLPSTTFINAVEHEAHWFTRYYATNQDSRTGMLSMLGSRFIPFEAYSEVGRDHYMKLGEKSSLLDRFKALHYRTAFAVSQREIELVVGDLPWDEQLSIDDAAFPKLDEKYLCFVPYEFEHSCEDLALLPKVLDFIDSQPDVFLYQEFVWGHASEYNKASGRTNTDYYSSYLDAIVAHLKKTGALDSTLIVLTSDHGFRDKGLQSQQVQYQIPLLFYATRASAAQCADDAAACASRDYAGKQDSRLFSHLSFKDLLHRELFMAAPEPAESPFVMMIGPTGTSFLSVLTQPGQFMLMKAREGERYLVHAEGYSDSRQSQRAAGDFLRLFEDYLTYFERL